MKIIDLFSGAGGLTEGFYKENFKIVAHVEKDRNACKTLETRLAYKFLKKINKEKYYHAYIKGEIDREYFINYSVEHGFNNEEVICSEINESSIESIFEKIDNLKKDDSINGIIGGPPCQAYSTIGRTMNSLKKDKDERIYLYKLYIKFLKYYNPEFFVFENVKGLLSFKDQFDEILIDKIVKEFMEIGYLVNMKIINAADYGVPQSRERLFIIGTKKEVNFFNELEFEKEIPINLKELFIDLPKIGQNESSKKYLNRKNLNKLNALGIREEKWNILTHHLARPHNNNDLKIYEIVAKFRSEGKRVKYNELPNELKTHKNDFAFLDRYKALNANSISHTVVAHISKDGHHYIHFDPLQNRSITTREAARIQTFSDDFYFESSRTAAFVQIGNAVPPYLSQKIAKTIKNCLGFEKS